MHRIQRSLSECTRTGLLYATGFTVLAAIGAAIGGASMLVARGPAAVRVEPTQAMVAVIAIVGSYYVAGLLGGAAHYFMQELADQYLGQVVLSFVLGGIAYGTIALSATVAYVRFGLNMFDFRSPAQAWHVLPSIVLVAAVLTAILGPLVWRARRT